MAKLRHFSYTFAANQSIAVNIVGSVIRCTEGAQIFDVEPDRGERIQLQEGIGLELGQEFKKWLITNGATAQTITVYIGDGEISDSRQYGSVNANISAGDTLTNSDDDVLAPGFGQGIPANADRKKIVIQASFSNTEILRVGADGAASSTKGLELTAGASYEFECTDAMRVVNPFTNADDQTYRYWEIS